MSNEKREFFRLAAKNFAASTRLLNVDSIVHVEDADDIWFWRQVLSKYRHARYKFKRASMNENGHMTTGCTQCMKYMGNLSQRFFVCIDSDLRYLMDEPGFTPENGVLQTYTYSFENHCAFGPRLQRTFDKYMAGQRSFDFNGFLERYSEIVYEPMLLMLYNERNGLDGFSRDDFKRAIALQYQAGDETDNGAVFLERLKSSLAEAIKVVPDYWQLRMVVESERYEAKGLRIDNAYLYVRGHCLYNSLVSIGKILCSGTGVDFEHNVMKSALAFEEYDEIDKIKTDIDRLKALAK